MGDRLLNKWKKVALIVSIPLGAFFGYKTWFNITHPVPWLAFNYEDNHHYGIDEFGSAHDMAVAGAVDAWVAKIDAYADIHPNARRWAPGMEYVFKNLASLNFYFPIAS